MAEQIAVRANMDVDIEADSGQVRFHIHMAGETLVAVRLSPAQALELGRELMLEGFKAGDTDTRDEGGTTE